MLLTTTIPILSTSKSFEQNNITKRNHFINGQHYILEIKILVLFISFSISFLSKKYKCYFSGTWSVKTILFNDSFIIV